LKKPAAGFPARAFRISCDGEYLPVICPTCQNLFEAVADPLAGAVTPIAAPIQGMPPPQKNRGQFPGTGSKFPAMLNMCL
jgi:hypothetical protein